MARGVSSKQSRTQDLDLALVESIARGDPEALGALYRRHGPGLHTYLCGRLNDSNLAEEVLQDVMLAVWQNAPRFRGECRVSTWLLSIARNRAINAYHRQLKPEATTRSLDDPDVRVPGDNPAAIERIGQFDDVHAALLALPDQHREVLEMVFFHNLSLGEISQVLIVPVGTVKSRLHRAKASLRELMGTEDES